MLGDQELLELNDQGFVPGPSEDEASFLKRVELTRLLSKNPEAVLAQPNAVLSDEWQKKLPFRLKEKLKKPDLSWVNCQLMHLYGFYAESFPAYFSNEKLAFFEGAATFTVPVQNHFLPLLQLRKELKGGAFWAFYKLEEILAHELVHFLRSAFQEAVFEEHFAYLTSQKILRRYFGPLLRSTKEGMFFLGLLLLGLVLQGSRLFIGLQALAALSYLSYSGALALFSLGLWRLIKTRRIFVLCLKQLKSCLGDKALPLMVRLTDGEIGAIAKMRPASLEAYFQEQKAKDRSLRWKVLVLAYLSNRH
ncbi:MAG: hypothetical protein WC371_01160 [Parachlamydiales bacterium]